MSDRMRELVGDPYADLYDLDGYPAMLSEAKLALAQLLHHPTPPDLPPWSDINQEIACTKRDIAEMEAKVARGIVTAVQELEGSLCGW